MLFLLRRLGVYRQRLALGFVLTVTQSILAYPTAAVIRWVFDQAVPQGNTIRIVQAGFLLMGLKLASALLASLAHRIDLRVCLELSSALRREATTKTLRLSSSYRQNAPPGFILETISADMARIDTALRALLGQVIPNAFLCLSFALVLLSLDRQLFCILLLLWPLIWLLNEYFRRRVAQATRECNLSQREMAVHLRWLVNSLDFIHIRHTETSEADRAQGHFANLQMKTQPMSYLNVDYLQIQGVLLMGLSLTVLLYGGTRVSAHEISSGSLFSFFLVVSLLNGSLREVAAGLYHVVVGQESMATVERFLTYPDKMPYEGRERVQLAYSLQLKDVDFGYPEGPPLFQKLSFEVSPGKVVALTGPNGSGKSTVIALLLGFYAPTGGALSADGVAYRRIDLANLRAQLGVVSQEALLFQGTIRENLTYGVEEASEARVWRALGYADAEDWVRQLPMGLETDVGEIGSRLSGGQRQKIAIARALLDAPPFLILDEPTNHLDLGSIAKILQTLRSLPQRPGILVVTHDEGLAGIADERICLS